MDKEIFESIQRGASEALQYLKGNREGFHTLNIAQAPESVDVKAAREKLGLSQRDFAASFGFSVNTLRHWESGLRRPERAARILLKVIERNPKAVIEALHTP